MATSPPANPSASRLLSLTPSLSLTFPLCSAHTLTNQTLLPLSTSSLRHLYLRRAAVAATFSSLASPHITSLSLPRPVSASSSASEVAAPPPAGPLPSSFLAEGMSLVDYADSFDEDEPQTTEENLEKRLRFKGPAPATSTSHRPINAQNSLFQEWMRSRRLRMTLHQPQLLSTRGFKMSL